MPTPNSTSAGLRGDSVRRLRSSHLAIRWPWLVVFIAALVVPWIVVVRLAGQTPTGQTQAAVAGKSTPHANAGAALPALAAKDGAWGKLELTPLILTPPAEYIVELNKPAVASPWQFQNTSRDQLAALFQKMGVAPELSQRWLAAARPTPEIRGLILTPPPGEVAGLSTEVRTQIYIFLGNNSENSDQFNAFRIPADEYEAWLGEAHISAAARDAVRRFAYRYGRFYFFADLPAVLPLVPAPEEKVALLRMLARQKTWLVELRLAPDADMRALAEYWGRGGRTNEVLPLLESLANVPGGETFSVGDLLPAFARRRLYTYPQPSLNVSQPKMDCHWTAMNFFAEQPADRFLNPSEIEKSLGADYFPVFGDLRLGDLILYAREDGGIIHTAVYVADDIVFTKNGSYYSTPWMFMRLDDMQDFYPSEKPLRKTYLRHRDF